MKIRVLSSKNYKNNDKNCGDCIIIDTGLKAIIYDCGCEEHAKEVVKYLDVLVDGQYMDDLHNPTLKWKGSSNQRVINVQESLKKNEVILMQG